MNRLLFALFLHLLGCGPRLPATMADAGIDASLDRSEVDAISADAPLDREAGMPGRCPEAVRLSARGEPIGVVSGRVRNCFPGEAQCYCDAEGDCYALNDYVPCIPVAARDL